MSKIFKSGDFEFLDEHKRISTSSIFTEEDAEILYAEAKTIVQELISEAEQKAQKIIKETQNKKKEIIKKAEQEREEIKEKTFQDAFQKGISQGREKGYLEIEELKAEARVHIQTAYQERAKILQDVEQDILELALAIARKIIKLKVEEDETIQAIALDLMQSAKNSEFVICKVNSNDIRRLERDIDKLQNIISPGKLKLDIDHSLSNGEAIIISQMGVLEAKIDPQLAKLKEALMEVKISD